MPSRNALRTKVLASFAFACSIALCTGLAWAAQEPTYDWQASQQDAVSLDPAGYHTGHVFKPADQAGKVHVDIEAQEPVTVEMAPAEEWSEALRHSELLPRVSFRCVREHVTAATYVCDVPAGHPMTLVLRDERSNEHQAETSYVDGASDHGTLRDFVAPNDIHVQYYRWACTLNCPPARYEWATELKQKYPLTPAAKIYGGISATRDGEPFTIQVASPIPLTVAVVPSASLARAGGSTLSEGALRSLMKNASCMDQGVRSDTFECLFNVADGGLSLVAIPESATGVSSHGEAELSVIASECVANCLSEPDK